MAFWTDANFEPKRQFRWKMSIIHGGEASAIEPFYAKKVTKPKLTMTPGSHKYLDRTFNFPGHVNWEPINASFVDDTGNTVLSRLVGAFGSSNYSDISGDALTPNKFKTISKGRMAATTTGDTNEPPALGGPTHLVIEQINAEGETVETWKLYNPFIKELTPGGDLDYEGDNLVEYTVGIVYDWAEVLGENIKRFQ